MTRPNRGRQARTLASALGDRFRVEVEAHYDTDQQGPVWTLRWSNGPTYDTFKTALGELGARLAPDIARWSYSRVVQDDAYALQAVRLGLANELHPFSSLSGQIEVACFNADNPDKPVDRREAAMAQRLLEVTSGSVYRMGELLKEKGVAWLLPSQATEDAGLAVDEPQTAVEVLTARYAKDRARRAWEQQAKTLPPAQAVDCALADPQVSAECIDAVLTLLPAVRAEAEARLADAEERAVALARQRGTSWARIGARLGVSPQAAQQRAKRRTAR